MQSLKFAAKDDIVTNHLKGKKKWISLGLLFLLALRLPASEIAGISLKTDTVVQSGPILIAGTLPSDYPVLNAGTPDFPGRQPTGTRRPTGGPLKTDKTLTATDSLRSSVAKASADTIPTSGILLNRDSLTLTGDTVRANAVTTSGKTAKPGTSAEAAEIHSPRKASIYSALLPGLGQAYNRKYWKIPLIYGGFGAFGYFISWNNKNYKQANKAYKDLTDDNPSTESYMKLKQIIYYDLTKASDVASLKQGLLSSQDYFRRNRDLLIIVTTAFYGLNIIDASVDAHFFNFDISDDLTLNWEPVFRRNENQSVFCVNCTFSF